MTLTFHTYFFSYICHNVFIESISICFMMEIYRELEGGVFLKKFKTLFLTLFLFLGGLSVYWYTNKPVAKTTVKIVEEKRDKELELLFTKSKSYEVIYQKVVSETHSEASGKAMLSYLESLREGDMETLQAYSTLVTDFETSRLISFYKALDYEIS
jgi:hypothetical protein